MKILSIIAMTMAISQIANAQHPPLKTDKSLIDRSKNMRQPLTPDVLWELGRVSAEGMSADRKTLIYGVGGYDQKSNKLEKHLFTLSLSDGDPVQFTTEGGVESVVQVLENDDIVYSFKGQLWRRSIAGGNPVQLTDIDGGLSNVKFSPDGRHILFSREVLVRQYHSVDRYADLSESNVYVYDNLDYRHWDTFNNGKFNHPFVAAFSDGEIGEPIDLLANEPYYSPQSPFGGSDDFIWSPDSKAVLYVSKKQFGTDYATSTNTDIYRFDLATGQTTNLTEGMKGYDTNPAYSKNGQRLAWLSMETDGYEADKNNIVVLDKSSTQRINLTANWDGTVNSYVWSESGSKIYFTAPTHGTIQVFEVDVPSNFNNRSQSEVRQVSEGQHDITSIVAELDDGLLVTSTRLTRAQEIYKYKFASNSMEPITHVNDAAYEQIVENRVESRVTKASDGQDLFSWVVYPPDFDENKKYPTLLYCQGGPQSPLTQFYSLRWNLQLIASQGYIVIAPNRRGMPGWGEKWNKDISEDWGGQPIRDYIAAIDDIAAEPYVDVERLGAIGASYGGYSVFMLAGVHENRFKTFISHCGLFDMTSWYGTTEELFFANYDVGGPYWENPDHPSYNEFNPIKHVKKWNTPILIIQGGKDYRVPIGQGLEAFQAAQLLGVKSRLMYLPDENHWVLQGHNAQVWQREFFSWLEETL